MHLEERKGRLELVLEKSLVDFSDWYDIVRSKTYEMASVLTIPRLFTVAAIGMIAGGIIGYVLIGPQSAPYAPAIGIMIGVAVEHIKRPMGNLLVKTFYGHEIEMLRTRYDQIVWDAKRAVGYDNRSLGRRPGYQFRA